MKFTLIAITVLASLTASASNSKVQIEIKADTEELCREASSSAELVKVEQHLRDKFDIQVTELTNCNKTFTGKFVKTIKFEGISDFNR